MKIISFIEEQAVIKQILQHLGLWDIRNNGPPPAPLNIVRKPVYQPVPDQAPAGDEVWSQVPNLWLLGGVMPEIPFPVTQ